MVLQNGSLVSSLITMVTGFALHGIRHREHIGRLATSSRNESRLKMCPSKEEDCNKKKKQKFCFLINIDPLCLFQFSLYFVLKNLKFSIWAILSGYIASYLISI